MRKHSFVLTLGFSTLVLILPLCSLGETKLEPQQNEEPVVVQQRNQDDGLVSGSAINLKVAFYPLKGFFEYDSAHKETGYGVEFLNKLSLYSNYTFSYEYTENWSDTQNKVLAGTCQVRMPATKPSVSATASKLAYTTNGIIDNYYALMTKASRDDLYYEDTASFSTIKIGLTENTYNRQPTTGSFPIQDYLTSINAQNVVKYTSADGGMDKAKEDLEAGTLDAIISNISDYDSSTLKILSRFCQEADYLTMAKNSPYLDAIDQAIYNIKMNEPVFFPNLYEKWFPERSLTPETKEEVTYIKNSKTLKVGMLSDRKPFSYYDSSTNSFSGITKDIMDLVSLRSGLKFEFTPVPSNTKPIDFLQDGQADLVSGVVIFSGFTNDPTLMLSDAFDTTTISVVKKKSMVYDVTKNYKVAIKASFQSLQEYVELNYPNFTIVSYNNDEESLQGVENGEADIALLNVYGASNMIQRPKFQNLSILPTAFFSEQDCCVTLSSSENSNVLINVLNKAYKKISNEEVDSIIVANNTSNVYQYTFLDNLYMNRGPIIIVSVLVTICIVLLIVLLVLKQKNSKKISAKNVQLAEALDSAKVASQAKGDFLARMSHEIRTPLNAIIGITTLAEDHEDDPALIKEDLNKISLSSTVLLSIINDVLDMSAIESGKMKIAHTSFDFKELINSLSTVYYTQCAAKGLSFKVTFINNVPETLIGDSLRLNQILLNLLSNAVKFTSTGSVNLIVEEKTINDHKVYLSFVVKDTGIGMDEDALKRVFQPFEQASANTAKKYGGSGLGLSIVKNLVTLMNGAISVDSIVGKGTTFTVNLPFEYEETPLKKEPVSLSSFRIMVIDDDLEARNYFAAVLKRIGVRFDCFNNGEEGIKALDSSYKKNDPYNVCIVDYKMPDKNGLEVTKETRKKYQKDSVIIIASAYDQNTLSTSAKEAGADMILTKPIFQSTLFDLLMSLTKGKIKTSTTSKTTYDFKGARVLLVEDNAINREVAVGFLKKGNVTCEIAENGKVALDKFVASSKGYYKAIFMDIQMPIMDGYEATKAIRSSSHPDSKSVPIIAMTANAFTDDISKALASGMNAHVSKPINLNVLFETLEKQLKNEGDMAHE
jgi:signal transduction histidine kinase/DNA-binding response OmpR family regulator